MNKESSRSHSIFTIYIETAEDVSIAGVILMVTLRMGAELVNRELRLAS